MESRRILSHVSIGTNQFEPAVEFYERVLGALGYRQVLAFPGAVAFGTRDPEFWVQTPIDGSPASVGNGCHFGFSADSRAAVDRFHAEALACGGTSEGEPGPRPDYGPAYYGCFVRDLDGHKVEAAWHDPARSHS